MSLLLLCGLLPPIFVLQRGIVWNSIQFLYYSLLIMGLLASISLSYIKIRWKKIGVVIILFFLMVPTTVDTLNFFAKKHGETTNFLLNPLQLEALTYVENLPTTSTILTPYEDTSYFTALTGKPVYFSDKTQADILLLPYQNQMLLLNSVYDNTMSESELRKFMINNNLVYLYDPHLSLGQNRLMFDSYRMFEKIFSNDFASVYKIRLE